MRGTAQPSGLTELCPVGSRCEEKWRLRSLSNSSSRDGTDTPRMESTSLKVVSGVPGPGAVHRSLLQMPCRCERNSGVAMWLWSGSIRLASHRNRYLDPTLSGPSRELRLLHRLAISCAVFARMAGLSPLYLCRLAAQSHPGFLPTCPELWQCFRCHRADSRRLWKRSPATARLPVFHVPSMCLPK